MIIKKSSFKKSQDGFTLIELLLAMTIFSSVLIISTAGFVAINRTFTRGLIRKQLSDSVQQLKADVGKTLSMAPRSSLQIVRCATDGSGWEQPCDGDSNFDVLCIGQTRYWWYGGYDTDKELGLSKEFLGEGQECDRNNLGTDQKIISEKFKVTALKVEPSGGNLYAIKGVVRTTNDEAFLEGETDEHGRVDPFSVHCKGSAASPYASSCAIRKFELLVNPQGEEASI